VLKSYLLTRQHKTNYQIIYKAKKVCSKLLILLDERNTEVTVFHANSHVHQVLVNLRTDEVQWYSDSLWVIVLKMVIIITSQKLDFTPTLRNELLYRHRKDHPHPNERRHLRVWVTKSCFCSYIYSIYTNLTRLDSVYI